MKLFVVRAMPQRTQAVRKDSGGATKCKWCRDYPDHINLKLLNLSNFIFSLYLI